MWRLEPDGGHLELPRFAAGVDPLDPARGLVDVRVDGNSLGGFHPLCVELPPVETSRAASSVECYVRGGDLVVAYADCPRPAMRAEVYWSAMPRQDERTIAAIELIVSVQTSLLDSRPRVWTRSELPSGDVLRLGDVADGHFMRVEPGAKALSPRPADDAPHCYLFRPESAAFSYLEMVHPSDVPTTDGEPMLSFCDAVDRRGTGGCRLRHQLFAESLEKGVILRARLLSVWLERADDHLAAAACYEAFLAAAPPLTR